MVRLTLELDLDDRRLDALVRALRPLLQPLTEVDELMAEVAASAATLPDGARRTLEAARRYKLRLNPALWELMVAAVELGDEGSVFTIDDLAKKLGVGAGEVRKRMRTLGRAKVVKEVAQEYLVERPLPWASQWDGFKNVYLTSQEWQDAISQAHTEEGR